MALFLSSCKLTDKAPKGNISFGYGRDRLIQQIDFSCPRQIGRENGETRMGLAILWVRVMFALPEP